MEIVLPLGTKRKELYMFRISSQEWKGVEARSMTDRWRDRLLPALKLLLKELAAEVRAAAA